MVPRFDGRKRHLDLLRADAFDYALYPPNGDEIERVVRDALN